MLQQMKTYVVGSTLLLIGIMATCFLPCLLIVQVLFVITNKIPNEKITGCCSHNVNDAGIVCVPRQLNSVLGALVGLDFFSVGFYGKRIFLAKCKKWMLWIWIPLFFAAALINVPVDMSSRQYGNQLLYIINSVLGSYILLQRAYDCVRSESLAQWNVWPGIRWLYCACICLLLKYSGCWIANYWAMSSHGWDLRKGSSLAVL